MTDEQIKDCYTALGQAFAERRELMKKITELDLRLRSFEKAISVLMGNQFHEESNAVMDEYATDPREDWSELKQSHVRLIELNKFLGI